jgi:hypothetical protein
MNKVLYWLMLGALLVGSLAGCAAPAPEVIEKEVEVTRVVEKEVEVPAEAGPVTLEVYNPTGLLELSQLHAPRLDSLEGKTICELSDLIWRDTETFPIIRDLLQERYPDLTIIPYTELPMGKYNIDFDGLGEIAQEKGCQAVIGGNCG